MEWHDRLLIFLWIPCALLSTSCEVNKASGTKHNKDYQDRGKTAYCSLPDSHSLKSLDFLRVPLHLKIMSS